MLLSGKNIFVISPEPWGKLLISKHNYALALAERGNRVFFFNPIDPTTRPGSFRTETTGVPGLVIVHTRPFFPLLLKFHAKPVFDFLLRLHVKWVKKKLKVQPDVIWDFYCSYLYNDLSMFGAALNIFQPVDHLAPEVRNKKADIVVSISDNLLSQYTGTNVPKLKVNHGLSRPFTALAQKPPLPLHNTRIAAGYIGNLTISSLDRELFLQLVSMNPAVDFNIIGPVVPKENNLGTNSSEQEFEWFINALRSKPNVRLHGSKTPEEIAAMLDRFDVLLLCYRNTPTYSSDNSHKVLEYMSSGKVIVSTWLTAYKDSKLLEMSPEGNNAAWPEVFRRVADNLAEYNRPDLQQKRKSFALENTYEQQIRKIESCLAARSVTPKGNLQLAGK